MKVFQIGRVQYAHYVKTRFVEGSVDVVKGTIARNALKLPKDSQVVGEVSPLVKLTNSVMMKLRDACINRKENALKPFTQEFTKVPKCLFDSKKNFRLTIPQSKSSVIGINCSW